MAFERLDKVVDRVIRRVGMIGEAGVGAPADAAEKGAEAEATAQVQQGGTMRQTRIGEVAVKDQPSPAPKGRPVLVHNTRGKPTHQSARPTCRVGFPLRLVWNADHAAPAATFGAGPSWATEHAKHSFTLGCDDAQASGP